MKQLRFAVSGSADGATCFVSDLIHHVQSDTEENPLDHQS